MDEPSRRPPSATSIAALALAFLLIWGHFDATGHGGPHTPTVLTTTSTWSVAGTWPWLRNDPNGSSGMWRGLAVGLVFTAAAAWICLRLDGSRARPTPAT